MLLLLTSLLSGCALQEYKARPLDSASFDREWRQRSLNDPKLLSVVAKSRGKPATDVSGWGLFELTIAAFHFNPNLDLARTRWLAAEAARQGAAVLPVPGMSGKIEHHSRASGVSAWTFGIGIEMPLAAGNRQIARVDYASAISESARLEIGAAAWLIRNQVRSRYVEFLAAENKRELTRRETALRGEIAEILTTRLAAGIAAAGEAAEARLQLRQVAAVLAADSSAVETSRNHLAEAISIPVEVLRDLHVMTHHSSFDQAISLPNEDSQRNAILDRFDFRAELARYAASEAKLRLEIARQYPEILLGPGLVFDQGDRIWSLGISLLSGLFDRNIAGIAEAEVQRDIAGQRVLAMQVRLISRQVKSLAAFHFALEEYTASKSIHRTAMEQSAATEKRLAAGHDDRLDLARQRLEALIAERATHVAWTAMLNTISVLEDTLQQPLDGTLPTINILPESSP